MLYIISKLDLSIKHVIQSNLDEIDQDINLNGKSVFTVTLKPNAVEGDYIIDKNTDYKGLISNIETEKEKSLYKINTNEIDKLFNRKIILANESLISTTGIEDFIVQTIKDNFSESSDTLLNISYINVTALTHTLINAKVSVTDGIYNLKTYLGNIKEKYDICLDYEFTETALNIIVSKKDMSTLQVDATIEDIITYKEIYQVDVISKVTVLATDTSTQFNYYLLTDRTITTDINNVNRAKGSIEVVTCQTDAEAYQKALDTFKSNSYKHNIELTITKDSKVFNEEDFIVGRNLQIKTQDNGIYDTFISGISKKSNSNTYIVTCGNMKVTLLNKLKGVIS